MTFVAWVEYSNIMIAVHRDEEGYLCVKYSGGTKVHDTEMFFKTIEELTQFLLSIPNAPTVFIHDLMQRLKL